MVSILYEKLSVDYLFLDCEVAAFFWARCLREVGTILNAITFYWLAIYGFCRDVQFWLHLGFLVGKK